MEHFSSGQFLLLEGDISLVDHCCAFRIVLRCLCSFIVVRSLSDGLFTIPRCAVIVRQHERHLVSPIPSLSGVYVSLPMIVHSEEFAALARQTVVDHMKSEYQHCCLNLSLLCSACEVILFEMSLSHVCVRERECVCERERGREGVWSV